ncbi:DUF6192 family protein [Streptomyces boncukensis]|uniref:DUF6192 family protein n=1 Tax=Streptomyces boncukensis TaxID=2711219 RepID=UPI001F49F7EF|nr:DUF6192 family protein [Streptomyces boncukensis]
MARAQFALGDKTLEIEPIRGHGGSTARSEDELFTVEESLALFADDIGVAASTVKDWRWTASRWPAAKRQEGVSFTSHRILASISDDAERWAQILDPPFNPRTGARRWSADGAKRLVGHRVDRPTTVEEKVQVVTDLTRDEEVARQAAVDLLRRPRVASEVAPAERVRVVEELARDEEVAEQVTRHMLHRPAVARQVMRDDTARLLVNRAQFDNSEATQETVRERTPAVRKVEHTMEYLDLVGSCHSFVASLGRLVPRMRGQEFTEDERETIRRSVAKVRAAADWLEAANDSGEFTLGEQLLQLLKGE